MWDFALQGLTGQECERWASWHLGQGHSQMNTWSCPVPEPAKQDVRVQLPPAGTCSPAACPGRAHAEPRAGAARRPRKRPLFCKFLHIIPRLL